MHAMVLKKLGPPLEWTELADQDGTDFLRLAPRIGIVARTTPYPLQQANQALADLRAGNFEGAAVLIPGQGR